MRTTSAQRESIRVGRESRGFPTVLFTQRRYCWVQLWSEVVHLSSERCWLSKTFLLPVLSVRLFPFFPWRCCMGCSFRLVGISGLVAPAPTFAPDLLLRSEGVPDTSTVQLFRVYTRVIVHLSFFVVKLRMNVSEVFVRYVCVHLRGRDICVPQ